MPLSNGTPSNGKQEMKLNKEVCKKCFEKRGWHWVSWIDDKEWEIGSVDCAHDDDFPSPINKIPEKCFYKLEHLILGNQDEA